MWAREQAEEEGEKILFNRPMSKDLSVYNFSNDIWLTLFEESLFKKEPYDMLFEKWSYDYH